MLMNVRAALFLCGVFVISASPCWSFEYVTSEQAHDLIDSTPDLIIVDVRGPSEYRGDVGHIPGAQNYPWYSGVLEAQYEEFHTYKPILVIGAFSTQSRLAADFLDSKGFSTVYVMQEGMIEWQWETEHYSGGSGTPNDPYQIATAEDLLALHSSSYKHYILTRDIDLDPNLPGGQLFDRGYVVGDTHGIFDGNGHIIANATISTGGADGISMDYTGFFGQISEGSQVIDLGLINVNVNGQGAKNGGFVGYNRGRVSNCYCTGIIRGSSTVGGLVGENWGELIGCWTRVVVTGTGNGIGGLAGINIGTLRECHSYSTVSGDYDVGGLVGLSMGGGVPGQVGPWGEIIDCFSECDVSGQRYIGGLVGDLAGTETVVMGCYSSGTVNGQLYNIGGLVGWIRDRASIIDSYSNCSVNGGTSVGGLVGMFDFGDGITGSVKYCYSSGAVKGDDAFGGLVGYGPPTSIISCFWDIQTSSQIYSDGGKGLTTAEMQNINTYLEAGWDFVEESINGLDDIWRMPTSGGYPVLNLLSEGDSTELVGQGTQQDPYLISAYKQLLAVNLNSNACYKLTATIDLSNILMSEAPIPEFGGIFDGNGYSIWGLRIVGESNVGLFGRILLGAQVNDLGVVDAYVVGTTCVGSLAGENLGGSINACYSTGSISGDEDVGGLIGHNMGNVVKCYSLTNSSAALLAAGGLIGTNDGHVEECYSAGDVTGTSLVGGFAGKNAGAIMNCYANGDVTGNINVGGLIGENSGTVSYCYSCGSVSADDNVGGLIGYGSDDVNFGYWDREASGQNNSAGGSGGNTVQMMSAAFYLGWEEGGKWKIDEGKDYPGLYWEKASGEPLSSASLFGGGNGTASDPYRISTVSHFYDIEADEQSWKHHFILMADIDLLEKGSVLIIAPQENRPFQGVFNGNGHTISNFKFESTKNSESVGLFGYIGSSGRITNLGLLDVQIRAYDTVGALVGTNNGSIRGCYATGVIFGDDEIGGIIGSNDGTVADCYAGVNVVGDSYVGGLIGTNKSSARVERCYSYGQVTGDRNTGGLLGSSYYPVVYLCYWDIETSKQMNSAAGIGHTTIEMMNSVTYSGWHDSNVWRIDEGNDYPRLVWENTPGDLIEMGFKGSGTSDDPYLIHTISEFYHFTDPVYHDKHLRLMVDVDLDPNLPDGRVFEEAVIPEFSATFDGNHHVIRNLTITADGRESGSFGLFGNLAGAEIRDLGVEDAQIVVADGYNVGGLAGYIINSSVSNCYCSGSFSYSNIWNRSSQTRNVGGLVGRISKTTVSNCFSSGAVSGAWRVGGLIGSVQGEWVQSDFAVTSCYSSANVSGTDDYAGGLLGQVSGFAMVTNCYSTGAVSGKNIVGGLIGDSSRSTVINCYSTGAVSGVSQVGGLVGRREFAGGTINNCFWDKQTSGIGWSDGGTGKTTAQMMSDSTFITVGWDFVGETANGIEDIWWIPEGRGIRSYPRLSWEFFE